MRRKLTVILFASLALFGLAYFHSGTNPASAPNPVKQDITVTYGYMTFSEAEALGCVQVQAGWACQLTGAGGGHAFKD